MSTIANLMVRLGVQDDYSSGLHKYETDTEEAGAKTKTFGSQVGQVKESVVGSIGKMAAAAGVMGGAFEAGAFLKGSIDAAENLEKAHAGLSLAIEKTGGDAEKLVPQFEAVAKGAQDFGINEVTAMQGLQKATLIAGSATAGMRAYREAVVISKATGQDFNAVLLATSKGQQGITTSLQRYGIAISKGTSGQAQLNMVMKSFGGQAEANTTVSDKLRARMDNLQASLGQKLLPLFDKFIGVLNSTVTGLTAAAQWVQKNWSYIAPFAAAIGAVVIALTAWKVATAIWTTATELATAAQTGLNAALDANPIGIVILALVALGAALYVLWTKSQTFRDIVLGVWNAIKIAITTVVDAVIGAVTGAWDKVKTVTTTVWETVKGFLVKWWPELVGALGGPIGVLVAMIVTHWGTVKSDATTAWNDIKSVIMAPVNAIKSGVDAVFGALAGVIKGAIGAVKAGITTLASVFSPLLSVLHGIESAAGAAANAIGKVTGIAGKIKSGIGSVLSSINPFASGTPAYGGGLALVGEHGPELVGLPNGSSVHYADETSRMLSGRGSAGATVHVENMNVRSDEDVRLWARDVSRRLAA